MKTQGPGEISLLVAHPRMRKALADYSSCCALSMIFIDGIRCAYECGRRTPNVRDSSVHPPVPAVHKMVIPAEPASIERSSIRVDVVTLDVTDVILTVHHRPTG